MKRLSKKYFGIGIAVALLTGGFGCQKNNDFSGPVLVPAQDDFALTTSFAVSDTTVNLELEETLTFSATFNQKASWKVVVKGLKSGAEKYYNGVGDHFTNESVVFDGRSNSQRFFISDEYLSASLYIMGHDSIFTIDAIKTIKSYSYHRKVINGVKHIVVDNYEEAGAFKYGPVSLAVAPDVADSEVSILADTNYVVEGNRSFKMCGRDDNNNSWSGGMNSENLIDFYLVDNTSELLIDSGIAPTDLYFNMYIYGAGRESTSVQFKVYEYDHKTFMQGDTVEAPIKSREDMLSAAKVPYDQSVNDGWIFDVEVTWTGWKLVSVPYSEFRAGNEFAMGGGGDRQKESWRICGMAVSLLSFPKTGVFTETYVDELVITQGGKFQKHK
jgi:hypothetical protein